MKVMVVGAGTMGAGIAQVCAAAAFEVTLFDVDPEAVDGALAAIGNRLERDVQRERLAPGDDEAIRQRLHVARDLGPTAEADVVLEAVSEDSDVKRTLWHGLGTAATEGALLGSNTSSLSITALGQASGRAANLCGLHFFNPAPRMPLVEVVRGLETHPETVARAREFAEALGKTPVVSDDRPGFLVNRLLVPYLNEAAALVEEGASATDVDRAMTLGADMTMGPLALADMVGLDVVLAIMETLQHDFGDPKYRPAPLLRRLVEAGRLGRKSGRGFHRYDENGDAAAEGGRT